MLSTVGSKVCGASEALASITRPSTMTANQPSSRDAFGLSVKAANISTSATSISSMPRTGGLMT